MTGALGHLGLTCADIQVVINSHLHFDHCANNYLFPQATFLVGDKEWGASRQPVEDQAVLYSAKEWLLEPLTESSYTLVEEDQFEVVPGVRVMKTPGHTPGHQVVLVDTGEGTISIAGDAVNCNENFLRDRPGGIVWDLELAIASLEKIREHSDSVLMAHDVRIADFQEGNFPSVPGPTEVTGGCC
jgi:glyoxylase-like metal-dependent hydrolase (beta-lactamase superfamily II)